MLRTENIFLHTRNSMKKEDLRRDKEDIRRLEKTTFQGKRLGVSTQTSKRFSDRLYKI